MTKRHLQTWINSSIAMLSLSLIQKGLGFIATAILSRTLGSSGLGAYTISQSTSQTCYGLTKLGADLGLHTNLASLSVANDKHQIQEFIGCSLIIFLIISLLGSTAIFFFGSTIASVFFDAPSLTTYIHASAILFAGLAMSQFSYVVFAGLNCFPYYSRISILGAILSLSSAVAGGIYGGAVLATWCLAIAQIVSSIMLNFALVGLLKSYKIHVRIKWSNDAAFSILKSGSPLYFGGLFLIFPEFANMAQLTRVAGIGTMGDMRVTQALVSIIAVIPLAISGPTITFLTERYSNGDGRAAMLTHLRIVWIFTLVFSALTVLIWPLAIHLAFGSDYLVASKLGELSIIGFISSMLLTVLQGALLSKNRSFPILWISLIQAAVLYLLGREIIDSNNGFAGYFIAQGIAVTVAVILTFYSVIKDVDSFIMTRWMAWLFAASFMLVGLIILDVIVDINMTLRLCTISVFTVGLVSLVAKTALHAGEWTFLSTKTILYIRKLRCW